MNYTHWTEMAALCPGVQYGLSSQESFGENKDLIFVKLTDSALRAIDEYLRNKNKFSCPSPTIKFLGNEGHLAFPSKHNGSMASFKFSMSSTQDMEGPGGSFECVQQSGPPRGSLAVLGSIPHKIRIHANDDVYATTRQRMTVAEEIHKNKCTREIKPNQTDIGRKIKVKQVRTPIPPIRKEPQPSMRDSLLKQPYQSSMPPSKPIVNSVNPVNPVNPPNPPSNGPSNGFSGNHVSSSRPQQNKPSVLDIAKRPIKERLIQLLALRPFKKVEIYERLMKEGLREKNSMTSVLKQIATAKDNCYHLNRAMWGDVNEDWPFYTESEKQILKRRKPQNLTPPGGSDSGSSGSGQSPTSTHPGSPPSSTKRPGYYDGVDGFQTKRQRVSHFRKPSDQTYTIPVENQSQRRPITDSRDASNMNPRSRESNTNGHVFPLNNGYKNGMLNDKRNLSDDEDNGSKKPSCDSHSISFDVNRERMIGNRRVSPAKFSDESRKDIMQWHNGFPNDVYNVRGKPDFKDKSRNKHERVSPTTNGISRVSPDSQTDPISTTTELIPDDSCRFPKYQLEYTTIQNADQRKQYKSDFNEHYAEYKILHGAVEKVSRRFAELEERLKQEDNSSPRYRDIKKQIVREYQENKRNMDHQKAKLRFQYLHEKLSHIKQLVQEYDNLLMHHQFQNGQY